MALIKKWQIKLCTKKIKAFQNAREHSQPSEEQLVKERKLYEKIVKLYSAVKKKKKFPFANVMILEAYRKASEIEDRDAQYKLAIHCIEEAKFRQAVQQEHVFASSLNEKKMKDLFAEGLSYLISAENLGHILAKRLHGLCYINAWGVSENREKGFAMVVESIDLEKSWDKVPQIFASIGLNKPEFFAALTNMRHKTQ
jgi:hypothetical protein